ncbi:MAG: hypothetical protein EAX95_05495 [Candidatus Thorarchaeota archaeon]|nr:hypothetical protein [Candidatus Thorarchaeota archaeon]
MVSRGQILKGAFGHLALFAINFFVMVGIVESFQIFENEMPPIDMIVLCYLLIHSTLLLSVQLSVQIQELVRMRMPTVLITYYFKFDDDETIPIPLLDPVKSKLGVLILLLVISGGILIYPIFAIYGFLLVSAILIVMPPFDIATIVSYFQIFLGWMPPLFALVLVLLILSIVIIEFRHV